MLTNKEKEALEIVKKIFGKCQLGIELTQFGGDSSGFIEVSNILLKSDEPVIQKIPAKTLEWGPESEEEMLWDEAVEWCKKQGEGWRLPTQTELLQAYDDEKIRKTFKNRYFWSATEASAMSAWYVSLGNRFTATLNRYVVNNDVRCVRDIEEEK